MIHIVNVKQFENLAREPEVSAYDSVRKMAYPIPDVTQLDVLSPSTNLFYHYRSLAKSGQWNQETFNNDYLPKFLHEIRSNPLAHRTLQDIWLRSKRGEKIYLGCYCPDETICHRSIIAGLLAGTGAEIVTETGETYARYYDIYEKLPR